MMQCERRIESYDKFRRAELVLALLVVALLAARSGSAASDKSPVTAVNAAGGTGVKGYDPVAYFTIRQPIPGEDQYAYGWKAVTYRFASAQNRERFRTDPEKYLLQYGGYCAYAMSINRIADIDPSRWAIVDGKLYLNNNYLSYDLWALNKSGNIASADRNWPLYPKKPVGE